MNGVLLLRGTDENIVHGIFVTVEEKVMHRRGWVHDDLLNVRRRKLHLILLKGWTETPRILVGSLCLIPPLRQSILFLVIRTKIF
jgi:hypothetical protein